MSDPALPRVATLGARAPRSSSERGSNNSRRPSSAAPAVTRRHTPVAPTSEGITPPLRTEQGSPLATTAVNAQVTPPVADTDQTAADPPIDTAGTVEEREQDPPLPQVNLDWRTPSVHEVAARATVGQGTPAPDPGGVTLDSRITRVAERVHILENGFTAVMEEVAAIHATIRQERDREGNLAARMDQAQLRLTTIEDRAVWQANALRPPTPAASVTGAERIPPPPAEGANIPSIPVHPGMNYPPLGIPVVPFLTHNSAPVENSHRSPLITTSESFVPVQNPAPTAAVATEPLLGPFCPGVEPYSTLVTPFKYVVDYRTYRLNDTSAELSAGEAAHLFKLKRQFDALYPTLGTFAGSPAIKLLVFLRTLKEGFDAQDVSEAVAVRVLAFFLTDSAKDVYTSLVSPGSQGAGTARALQGTWPSVVNALIHRFLPDDILQEAMEAVTLAAQAPQEDEDTFGERLEKAARDCQHVFTNHELVNHFIRGLPTAVRETVTDRARGMSLEHRGDLSKVRLAAASAGRTHRALLVAAKKPTTTSPKGGKALLIPELPEEQPQVRAQVVAPAQTPEAMSSLPPLPVNFLEAFAPKTGGSRVRWNEPLHPATIADSLAHIMYIGGDPPKDVSDSSTTGSVPYSDQQFTGHNMKDRPVLRQMEQVPHLTDSQISLAVSVIPQDYWGLNCWTCRVPGHTTFTCPNLSAAQRVYFAYMYYMYQTEQTPHMKEFLANAEARRSARAEYPQRGQRSDSPRRNQYGGGGRGGRGSRSPPRSPSPGGARRPPVQVLQRPQTSQSVPAAAPMMAAAAAPVRPAWANSNMDASSGEEN